MIAEDTLYHTLQACSNVAYHSVLRDFDVLIISKRVLTEESVSLFSWRLEWMRDSHYRHIFKVVISYTVLTQNYPPPLFCWLGLATSMGGGL